MDIDGDGNTDILSGSYSSKGAKPRAGWFQVLYGTGDWNFRKTEALVGMDKKPLQIECSPTAEDDNTVRAICTRPFALDWDADGDLDLLVGNFEGTFAIFRGEGKGTFSPKSELLDARLPKDYHSDPFCIDFDGDGDLDVISGSASGSLYWAENTAGKGQEIKLKDFQRFITVERIQKSRSYWPRDEIKPSGSSRVWVTDWNGDGVLDLLVGDKVTLKIPAEGLSIKEALAADKKWDETRQKAFQALNKVSADDQKAYEAALSKMNELNDIRAKHLEVKRTGHVWLYLGKK